jgi:hypothetical protein
MAAPWPMQALFFRRIVFFAIEPSVRLRAFLNKGGATNTLCDLLFAAVCLAWDGVFVVSEFPWLQSR